MNPKLHDLLVDGCQEWARYPLNLLRPGQLKHYLRSRLTYLDRNNLRLFDPSKELLDCLEVYDGANGESAAAEDDGDTSSRRG